MKIAKFAKRNKTLVMVVFIYLVLIIVNPERAIGALQNSSYYLKEMLMIMPVVYLLTVVLDALVPKDMILKRFGKNSGMKGNVFALILGSISAGPIYAAFPISKMLLDKGATVGNVVIVLSSWAVVKLPMLANEAKFLGVKFMVIRWILTVIAIFIMGYIFKKTLSIKDIPDEKIRLGA